jgi:hypothetical protein
MARMPDFESEIARDWGVAADTMRHLMHHHGNPQPVTPRERVIPMGDPLNPQRDSAPQPAAQAIPQNETEEPRREEPPMSLETIDADLREDLTAGITYGKELFARLEARAPGIIATVDAVANSTVGQIAEKLAGTVIPAEAEPFLLGLIDDFKARYGQPAAPAPAPAAPAAPVAAQ